MTSQRSWARCNGWRRCARRWPKLSRSQQAYRGGFPMLQLSDIQSSPEELQDYYEQLRAQHVTPAWLGGGISLEPQSQAVPYVWHWRDFRAHAVWWGELGRTHGAERPVLRPRP